MEIWHLRYFVTVAEERSFTRAAERLHMSTSPLSRRIQDLERELQTKLFVRTHHGVDLTPAGARLMPRAADVLARFNAISTGLDTAPTTAVVGIAPDVSIDAREGFLAAIAEYRPDVSARLAPASSGPLLEDLRAGHVDIALLHGPVQARGIRTSQMETTDAEVVVRSSSEFGARTSIRLEDLADLPFASVDHHAAPAIYDRLDQILRSNGINQRITLAENNFAGVAQVVSAGQAFTIVGRGRGANARLFAGEPVSFLPITGVHATLTTVAAWRADRAESETLIADLVAAAKSAAAGADTDDV